MDSTAVGNDIRIIEFHSLSVYIVINYCVIWGSVDAGLNPINVA